MNLQHRLTSIEDQLRAYTTGAVEYINDQWIFFDEESDEASLLEELDGHHAEVFLFNKWIKASFTGDGTIKINGDTYHFKDGDLLRIQKKLPFAYEEFLKDLSDETFFKYTLSLNRYHFSLFDCIYCHNSFVFQANKHECKGVNFIIYDNLDTICAVQHFYSRGHHGVDRFEFTLSNGKRAICSKMQRPRA